MISKNLRFSKQLYCLFLRRSLLLPRRRRGARTSNAETNSPWASPQRKASKNELLQINRVEKCQYHQLPSSHLFAFKKPDIPIRIEEKIVFGISMAIVEFNDASRLECRRNRTHHSDRSSFVSGCSYRYHIAPTEDRPSHCSEVHRFDPLGRQFRK